MSILCVRVSRANETYELIDGGRRAHTLTLLVDW